jgi:hypothetical protein
MNGVADIERNNDLLNRISRLEAIFQNSNGTDHQGIPAAMNPANPVWMIASIMTNFNDYLCSYLRPDYLLRSALINQFQAMKTPAPMNTLTWPMQ